MLQKMPDTYKVKYNGFDSHNTVIGFNLRNAAFSQLHNAFLYYNTEALHSKCFLTLNLWASYCPSPFETFQQ